MKHEAEAIALIEAEVDKFCRRRFPELKSTVGQPPVRIESTGASGTRYQLVVEALWDSTPGGTVRVIGMIDDGGVSALKPLTRDALVEPST